MQLRPCTVFRFVMLFVLAGPVACLAQAPTPAPSAFELKDGDRVVLLGDGLIEQEQYFGWIEVMLTTAYPERHVTFRNLGWSGDTPAGSSRFGLSLLQAGHEPANEGWTQLQKQLELTRPTLLILGYGMASSLEGGSSGVAAFASDFERLLQRVREISPDVRFAFLTPIANLSDDEAPVAEYATAIRTLAERHQAPLVDLTSAAQADELRKDPIHVNGAGYRVLAETIERELELPSSGWRSSPQTERLRQVILRKNQWWFHRSRPANMAYVFGFRKHEQGQNAVEIPQFDALIEAEEGVIAELRDLRPHDLPAPEQQLASQFAEFSEQPLPEFTVADGWEINLWAQNPDLNKPIHMNFDPQGRLWVASSEAYPMIEVGQTPPDKIIVLEDTNGDGRADASQVFADGLLIPTGVVPGNGGVYVAQSTDLLFLKDHDGDGRADEKTRVLSGFGTEDTHHNLHTLKWGPDGRLYMNQSVYTRTDAETPWDVVRLKAGGGFRYDTDSMAAEIFFRGLWNSWGHQYDAFGQSFLTDGAGFAGVAYSFPGATFNPAPKSRRQLGLISPGNWPKFASLEILRGANYPPDWQGSLVTCDFRANRVTRFSVAEQEAGFVTQQEPDLVRTSAATFRPIDVKQGPDGALYIADWSNPIINHGEVDFRDPRRDRWHGRIWRLTWKGAPPASLVDLTEQTTEALLARLTGDDRYSVDQARRVLSERGRAPQSRAATLASVGDWTKALTDEAHLLQALWLHQALKLDTRPLLEILLSAKDHRVRAAATRVLGQEASQVAPPQSCGPAWPAAEAIARLRTLANDEHPRVRLEAVCGLRNFPRSPEAAQATLDVLQHPLDRFVEHAVGLSVDMLSPSFLELLANGRCSDAQLEWLLPQLEPGLAGDFLRKQLAQGVLDASGSGPWIELIGKAGGPAELDLLFDRALAGALDRRATQRALSALARAQRLRKLRPTSDLQRIQDLIQSDDALLQVTAIQLAGTWKLKQQVALLSKLVGDDQLSDRTRLTILSALRTIDGPEATQTLAAVAENAEPSLRSQALANLAALDAARAVAPTLRALAQSATEDQALQLWRNVLNNSQEIGKQLAAQLADHSLPKLALQAGLRASNDGGRQEDELRKQLSQQLGLGEPSTKMTAAAMRQLAQRALEADPLQGEMIYRRPELACATCHAIGGVGGQVGPDMTSLGASAPIDYLVESLFDPNAKIKEGYHSVTVLTEDDQLISGIEVESSPQELVLRNAENQLQRIPQAEVVAKRPGKSLMPVGVVDRLSPAEQADLISFLSQLGKPGRFDATQGGVARAYEVFAGTHRQEQQGAERILQGEIPGWQPLQALVNGDVPRQILQERTKQPINIALVNVYLRCKIEVSQPSTVELSVPQKSDLWVDGQLLDGETTFATHLPAGNYSVIVRLDARDLPDVFRLEAKGVTFLSP